ncbi:MAG TPA: SNF2 helicase-associated domain-containing protein, partial [Candidatus Obscuribacterales bacterium]
MLILHGSLIENSFLVWAEDSDSPFLSEMPSRPSPSDEWTGTDYGPQQASPPDSGAAVAPPHGAFTRYLPFSATTKRLRDTLTAGVPFLSIARRQNGQIVVSIPSIGGVPCASSHMIAPVPKLDSGSLGLLHWKVSALRLDPIQIIDLLSYCADRELIAEGLAVGADISFWAGALRFAASLVARQQYLPGVSCEGEHPVAQWQPVFLGDDAARLGELARSMPLSCAAIGISAGSVDSSRTTELLARFITWCTDYLVRSACRTDAAQRRQIEIFQLEPGSSSIHSRWLVALFADDPTVAGTAEEISLLLSAIRDWQRPLKLVSDSPYRLCFRIEEPAPDTVPDSPADVELAEQADLSFSPEDAAPSEADCNNGDGVPPVISEIVRETCAAGSWYVRFLLQSIEEPSCEMVVPDFLYGQRLERISGDLGDLSPRELLLSLLGRAAKICPKIDESLTDSCPRGFYLSSEEAYDFLARVGPQLKGSGFSVQLPGWWVQRKPPLSASIKMSELNRGQALLSLHDLQEFDWTVALGGAEMSVSQLEDLVRLNIRL